LRKLAIRKPGSHLALKDGVMSFQRLAFQVPGVQVALHGTYGLIDEKMDPHGTAQLDVKLSQTVKGANCFFLIECNGTCRGQAPADSCPEKGRSVPCAAVKQRTRGTCALALFRA
jgi:hypothetical protein